MSDEFVGGHTSDDETEMLEQEFINHKRNYYITKMKYPEMTRYVQRQTLYEQFITSNGSC